MKKDKKRINKKSLLSEVLKIKGAQEILEKYRLPCLFCPMAKFEMENLELGKICEIYGISIEKLLKDLNKLVK